MEPAEITISLGVWKRQERRHILRGCRVDLEMISNSLSGCFIISKAYTIRNLELMLVPVCYGYCVVLKLLWIELRSYIRWVYSESKGGEYPRARPILAIR